MRVLGLLMALVARDVVACSCFTPPMSEASAREADHVFVFQLIDSIFVSTGEGSVIYEGAKGTVRVVETIRGNGQQFDEITFITTPCCGVRLDVGHYYVAFVSGSGSSFGVNEGNVADVTTEYSEHSEYPRSEQGIVTRVSALLGGALSLDDAIPLRLRSRISQNEPPPPPPCPEPAAEPAS